jgi:glucosylglycerate synthase
MPKSDLANETNAEIQQAAPVDLLVGIAGVVSAANLQQLASAVVDGFQKNGGPAHIVIAYPGNKETEAHDSVADNTRLMPYSLTASDPTAFPWMIWSVAQKAICSLAVDLNAEICVILHSDMGMLTSERLQLLMQPIQEKRCDLVLPVYPTRKFEGLLNHSLLAPLIRALYGYRVRYPLAPDLSCSPRMFQKLSAPSKVKDRGEGELLWPIIQAAVSNYQICQTNVDIQHAAQTEGLELSAVLTTLAGAVFAEMETYAPYWQRVRGAHPVPASGTTTQRFIDDEPADAKPLIDSFMLGSRNLQEVWGLVLPPVTLLELKKLSRSTPESFRMPDELWVRIVYDFALAYRLRKINRGHLMGALTPLYLGWVASYVQEMAARLPIAAEQRFEQLARAYEEGKPYLVSRWRWPDRFNP